MDDGRKWVRGAVFHLCWGHRRAPLASPALRPRSTECSTQDPCYEALLTPVTVAAIRKNLAEHFRRMGICLAHAWLASSFLKRCKIHHDLDCASSWYQSSPHTTSMLQTVGKLRRPFRKARKHASPLSYPPSATLPYQNNFWFCFL